MAQSSNCSAVQSGNCAGTSCGKCAIKQACTNLWVNNNSWKACAILSAPNAELQHWSCPMWRWGQSGTEAGRRVWRGQFLSGRGRGEGRGGLRQSLIPVPGIKALHWVSRTQWYHYGVQGLWTPTTSHQPGMVVTPLLAKIVKSCYSQKLPSCYISLNAT